MNVHSAAKRVFDVLASASGLCLLALWFFVVAAIIKLSDGGPVFYRQERVGRWGRSFWIWKFRTMIVDADKHGSAITVGRDPRITWIGHWLRKLKLDELPQLLNVLVGEMSFVGPRPEVPKYVELYTAEQRRVLEVRPGLTDPASIEYRDESDRLAKFADPQRAYVERIMPDKLRLSAEYLATANLWSDIGVLAKTVWTVFGKRRASGDARSICFLSAEHPPLDKRVFQKEAVSLARGGFHVTHLCPDEQAGQTTVDGVRLVSYRRRAGKWARLLRLPALFWRARALRADVYHCNEPDSWLVGVALRFLCGKHVVFDCHEYYPGQVSRWLPRPFRTLGVWAMKLYLELLGLVTHRIVLAKYSIADDFSWSRKRQTVVLNTTPLAALGGATAPRDSLPEKADDKPFVFVHIGVMRRERGSEELLAAARLLNDRGIDSFRIVLIGEFKDGSESDFVEKARIAGLLNQIELHSWMPFDDAIAIVQESDAGLILFQKTLDNNIRGMPHKMFDYMTASLPVIAPDFAPDIVGVLNQADAGMLIDTADAEVLADAMQALMEDRCAARDMGRRGRALVERKFNWERDAETLIAMYCDLLDVSVPSLDESRPGTEAA